MSLDAWSDPKPIPDAYTNADPALTTCANPANKNENTLVLAFKGTGNGQLYITTSVDGKDWTPCVNTGQSSAFGPALAVYGGEVYMLWLAEDGSNRICCGPVKENGTVTRTSFVANGVAKSSTGPAGVGWSGNMYCAHIGESSTQLYCDTYTGSWGGDTEVSDQYSQDAPALASASSLFLIHRGWNKDTIWWSTMLPSGGFSTNQSVPYAASQHRPGAGTWNGSDKNYVVLVHNGERKSHLLWHYYDGTAWHYEDECRIGMQSDLAPALSYLQPSKGIKAPSTTYMVYVTTDGSNQLRCTSLNKDLSNP